MVSRKQTCKQFRCVVGCALDAATVPSAISERLLAHRRRVFGGLHQTGHHIRRSPTCSRLLPLQQSRTLRAGARLSGPRMRVAGVTETAKHNVYPFQFRRKNNYRLSKTLLSKKNWPVRKFVTKKLKLQLKFKSRFYRKNMYIRYKYKICFSHNMSQTVENYICEKSTANSLVDERS